MPGTHCLQNVHQGPPNMCSNFIVFDLNLTVHIFYCSLCPCIHHLFVSENLELFPRIFLRFLGGHRCPERTPQEGIFHAYNSKRRCYFDRDRHPSFGRPNARLDSGSADTDRRRRRGGETPTARRDLPRIEPRSTKRGDQEMEVS